MRDRIKDRVVDMNEDDTMIEMLSTIVLSSILLGMLQGAANDAAGKDSILHRKRFLKCNLLTYVMLLDCLTRAFLDMHFLNNTTSQC